MASICGSQTKQKYYYLSFDNCVLYDSNLCQNHKEDNVDL